MGIFPALVLFLIIPLTLYIPNQEDFNFQIEVLLPFFYALSAWFFMVVLSLLWRKHPPEKFFVLLFFCGLFFLLKDILSPLAVKGIIGLDETIVISEPWQNNSIEFFLFVALVFSFFFVSGNFLKKIILPLAGIFILVNIGFSLWNIHWHSMIVRPVKKSSAGVELRDATFSKKGNVYLICLDGFIGANLQTVLAEGDLSTAFAGFTHFVNNKTNYSFTLPSLASTLSGTFYESGNIEKWLEESRFKQGIIKDFADHGFNVWMYASQKHEAVPENQFIPRSERIVSRLKQINLMGSIWILRVMPTFLKKEAAGKLADINSNFKIATANIIANALQQLGRFVEDEVKRPPSGQFVFVPVYIPHGPHIFNSRCDEVLFKGSYLGQAACCLSYIGKWLSFLKTSNRFKNAVIIIFGDHGQTGRGTEIPMSSMSSSFKHKLKTLNAYGPEALNLWASTLLLVKPPGLGEAGSEALCSDYRQTQNGDIPATLAELTGIPLRFKIGLSVCAKDFPQGREVDVFDGFAQNVYPRIKKKGLWQKSRSGELFHFRYSLATGWSYIKNILSVW